MSAAPAIAYVLADRDGLDPDRFLALAAGHGLPGCLAPEQPAGGRPLAFELDAAGPLLIMPLPRPLPSAGAYPPTPWGPPAARIAAHTAHFVLALPGLPEPARRRDPVVVRAALALCEAVDGIGLALHHGVNLHRPEAVAACLRAGGPLDPPVEVVVDLRVLGRSQGRIGVLSVGMHRYGREELLVTTPGPPEEAVALLRGLARWLIVDPEKRLPTDDTVGRHPDERIPVQRIPHPERPGEALLRLDMPGR